MASSYGQVDSVAGNDIFELSLQDLLNVPITSASRKEESSFDAPLSTCVITRQDIANTGVTSVPDALKLCPAIVVRERFNGSYDVSIRGGGDGFPAYGLNNTTSTVLVMINNRPVFNALGGGTFWQNLPIVLTDIERIEVVEGPAAPLFGPNAVNGIVNIITRDFVNEFVLGENNVVANANVQSSDVTHIIDATMAYKVNEKIAAYFSVNNQSRKRLDEEYYNNATQSFVSDFSKISDTSVNKKTDTYFPEKSYGIKTTSFNTGVSYKPSEKKFFDLSAAYNENTTLFALNVSAVPINTYMNQSSTVVGRGTVNNFSFMGSAVSGFQTLTGKIETGKYYYRNLDGYIDYDIKPIKNLSIKPALSIQSAYVNDKPYTIDKNQVGVFNGEAEMVNYAASVKADYNIEKFRVIGAVRADKFSFPKNTYPSYQFIFNYKPNKNNIIRLVAGRSYAGSYLSPTFVSARTRVIPPGNGNPYTTEVYLVGNKERDIRYNDSYEIGYRTNTPAGQFDIALFSQNYGGYATNVTQTPIVDAANNRVIVNSMTQNIPLKVNQLGATISGSIPLWKNKIIFKPHVTIQQTKATNYSPYNRNARSAADTVYVATNTSNVNWHGTPDYFGGFTLQVKPVNKIVVTYTAYFYSSYYLTTNNAVSANGSINSKFDNIFNISAKDQHNLYVGYDIKDNIRVYFNGRNIFNNTAREDAGTDKIGAIYMVGINYGLK